MGRFTHPIIDRIATMPPFSLVVALAIVIAIIALVAAATERERR